MKRKISLGLTNALVCLVSLRLDYQTLLGNEPALRGKQDQTWESRELSTYPSPKLTSTLTSHFGQNVGLGEG